MNLYSLGDEGLQKGRFRSLYWYASQGTVALLSNVKSEVTFGQDYPSSGQFELSWQGKHKAVEKVPCQGLYLNLPGDTEALINK